MIVSKRPVGAIGTYSKVMGHEGIGWVRKVGSKVTSAQIEDCVSLTISSCSKCRLCTRGHRTSCEKYLVQDHGQPPGFTVDKTDAQSLVDKVFVGEDKFASWSNVKESSVVNISHLISEDENFSVLAPLDCKFQTGAGTVTKLAGATSDDSITILGAGAVGMSAMMAAKILGCNPIITVDCIASRLILAKTLGATYTVNTEELDLADQVRTITGGIGSTITIDTSGIVSLIKTAIDITARIGKIILVGVPPLSAAEIRFDLLSFLRSGKSIVRFLEGDVIPSQFVPEMIKWYKNGEFPIDKLVKTYKAEEFGQAISDMISGSTVKSVLLW
ncbi:hypothetical protein BOTCAL_0242g00100 [Botryotinia calthae]|uniref:Enoyl reductase (ER) domain-containing protein n=1 Tax=Botryotinia calthae TaxID=38488 RepID=A0A4Y8CXV8_9HELO|nr:hypothetical protein BOTCAL_0242g00100 [Botryotinia calthae]